MIERVALITGGMGGLGETISTKMAIAGYKVAVTYSPSNKNSAQWLAEMEKKGHKIYAYPCDVTDFDSSKACVAASLPHLARSIFSSTMPASPKT